MKERFPRFPFEEGEKEMEMPCEVCGELGHSLEECPRLSKKTKEEVEKILADERLKKRIMMERQMERGQDVEDNRGQDVEDNIRGKEGGEGYKENI
jgi:hypothetical protein